MMLSLIGRMCSTMSETLQSDMEELDIILPFYFHQPCRFGLFVECVCILPSYCSHPLKMSVITALQLAREADPTSYPPFFD